MKTSFFFVFRIAAAWTFAYLVFLFVWSEVFNGNGPDGLFFLVFLITLGFVIASAVSHIRRIRLIAGNIDPGTLANRQRRQIEIPLEAGVAFDLVDATMRELPRSEDIESARDSLQVRAKVTRINPYSDKTPGRFNPLYWIHIKRNQILATVTPGDGISSLTL
ncbi:MAG: sensor histidine kinase, partial [Pseudoxanthomonas sp.]